MKHPSELKQQYRTEALKKRRQLSHETFISKCQLIESNLVQLKELLEAKVIHCFYPIKNKQEIDLLQLYQRWLKEGKRLFFPKMVGLDLCHIEVQSMDSFEEGKWGVVEPVGTNEVECDQVDVVLVPMLAGDVSKNRLGYGKGYYDRFLALHPTLFTAGIVFDFCVFDKIPTEKTDIPLNCIVTDTQIIR